MVGFDGVLIELLDVLLESADSLLNADFSVVEQLVLSLVHVRQSFDLILRVATLSLDSFNQALQRNKTLGSIAFIDSDQLILEIKKKVPSR